MKRAKAHQRYKTSKGEPAVGVTTVLGVMNKPALVKWANNLGLEGIDSSKYVDGLARIGILIHYLIECDIKGIVDPDLKDYTANEISTASEAFKKWVLWKSKVKFDLLESEKQIVSDDLRVGGTCDILARVNDKVTVLDIKTSKACYSEARSQVVAYGKLLEEHNFVIDEYRIIRVGRNEHEGFDDILIGGIELHWKRFLSCLQLYRDNKNLENTGA